MDTNPELDSVIARWPQVLWQEQADLITWQDTDVTLAGAFPQQSGSPERLCCFCQSHHLANSLVPLGWKAARGISLMESSLHRDTRPSWPSACYKALSQWVPDLPPPRGLLYYTSATVTSCKGPIPSLEACHPSGFRLNVMSSEMANRTPNETLEMCPNLSLIITVGKRFLKF